MICVLYNQEKKIEDKNFFFKERSANVQKTKNQSAVFQNLNNQSDGFWPINHICEKRDRMKTPNMKKKPTRSKCFSYVLFMMASNWVYYRLTELYFSGTEAAEPKIITTSTEYGSVRKNIVYSKNYSHSLSHYYYLLYYKQCLFTKDISSIMSGLETKKKHSTKSIKIFLSTALNVNHKN